MHFGENLQNLRKIHNYSQEELAEELLVSRQSVSKWESGGAYPETDKLIAICTLFNCSMDELVKGQISINATSQKAAYNKLINEFSIAIAFAIMLILGGVTAFLTRLGFNADRGDDGIVLLLIFVALAVPIFIVKGIEMESFKKKYPTLPNFYNSDEIERYSNRFSKLIALAVSLILIGVAAFMAITAQEVFAEDSAFPAAILVGFVTFAVPLLVYAGIQKDKYDIAKYNQENSAEAKIRDSKIGKYCSIIMILATAIYLAISFIFRIWEISWLVFPIGGMICGAVTVLLKQE